MAQKEKTRGIVWLVVLVAFFILLGFVWNTLIFHNKLNKMVNQYLVDHNEYQADKVTVQIKSKYEMVQELVDTIKRMPHFLLTEELLERKTELFNFDSMAVISMGDDSGVTFGEYGEELAQWLRENQQIWKKKRCTMLEDHSIVFAAPVKRNGKIDHVVAGMQKNVDFNPTEKVKMDWDKGIFILRDRKSGKMLEIAKGKDTSIREEEMMCLMDKLEKTAYKKEVKKGNYYASAKEVEGTDWIQIGMIHFNDLIPQVSRHILAYFLLTAISFFIFVIVIIQLKKSTGKKEKIFLTDTLTGGLNREGFVRKGEDCIEENKHLSYAVVCLNICNFRRINELWGEENGNKTLKFVYQSCQESLESQETMGRSSIDHFLLLLHGETQEELKERMDQIIGRINSSIQKQFDEYHLDFMIGICQVEEDLITSVNHAVYVSKNSTQKNSCHFYDNAMIQKIVYENELDALFPAAIKNHDFKIFLQPKVSSKWDCQAEVLVRWIDPEKGMIYPDQFISLFEQNGKIVELDLYVFEESCRMISQWIREGQQVTKLSVNVSRFTLQNLGGKACEKYKEIKEKYQIPDWMIEIEITETALLNGNQISYIKHILRGFHSCGIKVALDDFGFAYSSLAVLKSLDVNTIKLDRSFFVNENEKSKKIVASMIQLSHKLGICVVAEGIEEVGQAELLYENGCDFIQGYVYSKPLSVEEFMKWKEKNKQSITTN